jgi:glycosyltransferase involved in cell wall biosynthesis
VTDVGGNPEAVLDGETGLIVPPRTPSALGQAVLRLAKNEDLRCRLGAAALLRVQEKFSSQSCTAEHERLYEELLTGGAVKPSVQSEVVVDC